MEQKIKWELERTQKPTEWESYMKNLYPAISEDCVFNVPLLVLQNKSEKTHFHGFGQNYKTTKEESSFMKTFIKANDGEW